MGDDDKYDDPYENLGRLDYEKDVKEYKRNWEMYDKLCALLTEPQVFHTDTIRVSRIRKVRKDMKVYDETVPRKIKGEYTKGHVLSNGSVIPLRVSSRLDTTKVEPPMSDAFIRKLVGQDDGAYETDYEGDNDHYIPKEYL